MIKMEADKKIDKSFQTFVVPSLKNKYILAAYWHSDKTKLTRN